MKIAIYARVSKSNGDQTADNQIAELTEAAAKKGWTVAQTYLDQDSGSKSDREQFQQMMRDAIRPRRAWDLLFFWSLDRFSREGVSETFEHLKKLDQAGIAWVSLKEEYLDTTGIFKDAIIAIMATLAKQERLRIIERTNAGLARARAKGVRFGRKPVKVDMKAVRAMRAQDMSLREIGAALGVGAATIKRRLEELS